MAKKPFYVTTPIYYPSNKLHIGNCYTTVVSDVLARYKRLTGHDVFFLTGMDEHGQKIQRTAAAQGMEPQAFVDGMAEDIKRLWDITNISYDGFIRTTDEHHRKAVQHIFTKLYEQGDIYRSAYEGWYCTSCESYWTEAQAVDGCCPDCGKKLEWTKEENFFFRLSKYSERILEHIKTHPEFLQPESRAKELITNFLEPGLEDIAVSRNSFDWGVKVPQDPSHVVYVWIDALSNYISALGYPENEKDPEGAFQRYWPADVHLVGKDISRFHALIWTGLLMALELPLPQRIFAHGWLLMKEGKMSKSKGNVVYADQLCERYGTDAVRYFLMREIPFGMDGQYTHEAFFERINADLANDLGNLLSRSTAMLKKYFAGVLPQHLEHEAIDQELFSVLEECAAHYREAFDDYHFNKALTALWRFIGRANKFIDETCPWILAKDEDKKPRLAAVLACLLESLRQIAIALLPFMPDTAEGILKALGLKLPQSNEDREALFSEWGLAREFEHEGVIEAAPPMFPRLDLDLELAYVTQLNEKNAALNLSAQAAQDSKSAESAKSAEGAAGAQKEKAEGQEPQAQAASKAPIEFSDFERLNLRVATVLSCQRVENADKLLQFELQVGEEKKIVVSGIAQHYKPEDLVGRQLLYLQNLKPKKIRGILSEGMLLCAQDQDGSLSLMQADREVASGSEVG